MKSLLIITDNIYVSALLFHGYGLPPWYDLPEIQKTPDYRNKMTNAVNEFVLQAEKDGFQKFDIHEAFPVNLMTVSEKVEILRNIDHFLLERNYSAVSFVKIKFDGLKKQAGLSTIKKISLNKHEIDETEIIKVYFNSNSIPVYNGDQAKFQACGNFRIEFDEKIKLKYVDEHPFIQQRGHAIEAKIDNAEKLLEVYNYAGIQIRSNNL